MTVTSWLDLVGLLLLVAGIALGVAVVSVPLGVAVAGVLLLVILLSPALLLIGLFTRPMAFVLCGFMAVAYFMAHASQGSPLVPLLNQGELAVLYCFVFLYFAAAGAGRGRRGDDLGVGVAAVQRELERGGGDGPAEDDEDDALVVIVWRAGERDGRAAAARGDGGVRAGRGRGRLDRPAGDQGHRGHDGDHRQGGAAVSIETQEGKELLQQL